MTKVAPTSDASGLVPAIATEKTFQEALETALVGGPIDPCLIDLDAADLVIRRVAEEIERHDRIADRLRWFLGDYYNALRTRYSRDEIANALTPLVGSAITISTIEDYAMVCRRIPPEQRGLFESIHAAQEVARRSISYARQELGVSNAQMRTMNRARQMVEERAREMREAVLRILSEDPQPASSSRAIEAIESYVRAIRAEKQPVHVQITHRVQRPPLTIEYAPSTITGSPIGGIQGAMSALEFMSRLVRALGLRGQRVPVKISVQNPATGYEYRFEFILHTPASTGDPYHIAQMTCEEILPAEYDEES